MKRGGWTYALQALPVPYEATTFYAIGAPHRQQPSLHPCEAPGDGPWGNIFFVLFPSYVASCCLVQERACRLGGSWFRAAAFAAQRTRLSSFPSCWWALRGVMVLVPCATNMSISGVFKSASSSVARPYFIPDSVTMVANSSSPGTSQVSRMSRRLLRGRLVGRSSQSPSSPSLLMAR